MDYHHSMLVRRPAFKSRTPAARWLKEWVPQEIASTGKKCYLLKWVREDTLKNLKEKSKEPEPEELKPEPTSEILYLCNYDGCNKSFPNEGAYRRHSHIHGTRQYVCPYPGCLKKFFDSSKLKRHQVVHTGVKEYICKYEGCGKAFNLDFNLRAHMRTHSQELYHVCPFSDCGKKYTQESKLKAHMKVHSGKNSPMTPIEMMVKRTPTTDKFHTPAPDKFHTPTSDKFHIPVKAPTILHGSGSNDRPFVCHVKGCGKDYIHEYKLSLHLRTIHPDYNPEYTNRHEAIHQESYIPKSSASKNTVRSKQNLVHELPSARVVYQRGPPLAPPLVNLAKKPWPVQMYADDSDSEETEEEQENIADDRWRFHEVNDDDDEETDEE